MQSASIGQVGGRVSAAGGETMKRFEFRGIGIAVAVLLMASLSACGGDSGSEAKGTSEVSYGGQTIVPDLVFRGKDWSKTHEVDIKQLVFPSGNEAFAALLSGEANVSNGGSGRLITVAAQQPDAVTIVAQWQFGGDRYSILTAPGSAISSAADLKGKKVAVDPGSGAFTLFQEWLRKNGVKAADVEIVQTKIDAIGAALQSESADVGVAWEPTASLLVDKKIADRMTTLKEAGQSPNFLLANSKWAKEHRAELVAFLKAAVDVGNFIKNDPEAAGKMAAEVNSDEGVEVSASVLAEALRHIEMTPEVDDASLEELATLSDSLVKQKKILNVPDFKAMVDTSYLKEALGK